MITFVAIGCILLLGSICWLSMERKTNMIFNSNDYMSPSIEWDVLGEEFTYEGQKYVLTDLLCVGDSDCIMEEDSPFYANYFVENCENSFSVQEEDNLIKSFLHMNPSVIMERLDSPLESDMYFSSDEMLYCLETEKDKIVDYYKDMSNYKCYFSVRGWKDEVEIDKAYELTLDEKEIEMLNSIVEREKIEFNRNNFGSYDDEEHYYIDFVSEDNLLHIKMEIQKFDGKWYWDTEEDTYEESDNDLIYVIELPETVCEKINY